MQLPDILLPVSLLTSSGMLCLHGLRHRLSGWLVAALTILSVLCIYGQVFMVRPLSMLLQTEEFRQVYGKTPTPVWFHWHEMFHYYLGAKYYPEMEYKGLYESALLADTELAAPGFPQTGLRSLSNPMYKMDFEEGIAHARRHYRPRFTDRRWEALKKDLQALEDIASPWDMPEAIWDVGFNPPPTWAVFGHTVANLLPIAEEDAWLGNRRPYWYQAHWVPMIDVLLLLTTLTAITMTFGPLAGAAFIALYACSLMAQYNWTSGSFFRYTWLCELALGLCFLKKQRWFAGGLFLGLSAVDRVFPLAFTLGAALPVLWDAVLRRRYRPMLRYGAGAGVAIIGMVALSLALFGVESWDAFYEKIRLHRDTNFLHSVGYMRFAVYGPDIYHQFLPEVEDFRLWNEKISGIWHEIRWRHYPFIALLLGASVIASLRVTAFESALLFGSMLFFTTQVATAYYYMYLPLIAVALIGATPGRVRDAVLCALFVLQAYTWFAATRSEDKIVVNFYNCVGLLVFFGGWAFARAAETLRYYQDLQTRRLQAAPGEPA